MIRIASDLYKFNNSLAIGKERKFVRPVGRKIRRVKKKGKKLFPAVAAIQSVTRWILSLSHSLSLHRSIPFSQLFPRPPCPCHPFLIPPPRSPACPLARTFAFTRLHSFGCRIYVRLADLLLFLFSGCTQSYVQTAPVERRASDVERRCSS